MATVFLSANVPLALIIDTNSAISDSCSSTLYVGAQLPDHLTTVDVQDCPPLTVTSNVLLVFSYNVPSYSNVPVKVTLNLKSFPSRLPDRTFLSIFKNPSLSNTSLLITVFSTTKFSFSSEMNVPSI